MDAIVDETRLVAALKAGDEWAFETVVRLFSARLLVVARRYVRNEEDARDVLQSAYLSAFRALAQFEGSAQLSTWLHRIVVNTALTGEKRSRGLTLESDPETALAKLLAGTGLSYTRDGKVFAIVVAKNEAPVRVAPAPSVAAAETVSG